MIGSLIQLAEFQSTPPVKAATSIRLNRNGFLTISIHAAREGGDHGLRLGSQSAVISIHAAREGGDAECAHTICFWRISIHAAREGGDQAPFQKLPSLEYFNPRRP